MPAVFRQIWLCTQTVIMTITGIYGRLVEKALTGETEKVFDLLAEMLTNTKLFDEKRLYEIIAESRSIKQSSLLSAGHTTAVGRAMAYMKKNAYLTEYIRGIAYYDIFCAIWKSILMRERRI